MLRLCLFIIMISVEFKLLTTNFCGHVEVRNDISYLKMLRHCTKVRSLTIALMFNNSVESIKNAYYPNLREIVEYFIIYEVNNITTLGQIFPNLQLIRGKKLFMDYAFVITRTPELKEVNITFFL